MIQKANGKRERRPVPANGRANMGSRHGLHTGRGATAGGFFILVAILVMLCPLLAGSCSKEQNRDVAPPSAAPDKPTPPAAQPAVESRDTGSPAAEVVIPQVLVENYIGSMTLANIGVIGFSDALEITGEVTNNGDLIIDEVELRILYLNVTDRTGYTEQHKLIGESSSPKPLLPGQTQPFEYKINSEYYAKAPEVDVEITNLRIRPPGV